MCIRRVERSANRPRGLSAALQREGAWTYVFGGLIANQDGETLAAVARLLANSEDGLLPWAGRPEPLKRGLVARVPPALLEGRICRTFLPIPSNYESADSILVL
jgi:predicted metal-binding protein